LSVPQNTGWRRHTAGGGQTELARPGTNKEVFVILKSFRTRLAAAAYDILFDPRGQVVEVKQDTTVILETLFPDS